MSSYHTDIQRLRSGRSTTERSFEETCPSAIHGLDVSRASHALKKYSSWVKGQQSSSMEVEPGETDDSEMLGRKLRMTESGNSRSGTNGHHPHASGEGGGVAHRRRRETDPRKSHFREELGPTRSKSGPACEDMRDRRESNESNASRIGLDGQGDRRPSQQHRRSTAQLMLGPDDEAASLWEKALQNHASQMSMANGQSSRKRSVSPSIGRPSQDRRMSGPKSHSVSDIRQHQRQRSSIAGIGPDEVPTQASALPTSQEERPSGMWARFPSHNRHERAESAGSADRVSTYDFGSRASSESLSPEAPKKRDSNRQTRPQGYFSMLKARYSNELTKDFRRLERGYRSSVSTGGVLEQPELELLPKLSPAFVPRPKAASAPTGQANDMSMARKTMSSEYDNWDADRSSSEGAVGGLMPPPPRSAKAWSKIYNECVDGASEQESSEEGSAALKRSSESSRPGKAKHRFSFARHLRPTSSESAMNGVRTSTVDFQRSLRLQEAESLKRVFQAVERLGEDAPPPAHPPSSTLTECSVA